MGGGRRKVPQRDHGGGAGHQHQLSHKKGGSDMASMRRTRTIPPSRQGDVLPAPATTAPVPRTPDRLMDDATLEELVTDVQSQRAREYLAILAQERTQRRACAVSDISHTSVWRWRQ